MFKLLLFAATWIAGASPLAAQVPDNRTEAANPAPRALQNAPPDKIAPSPLNSPNVVAPDTKAETAAPALKMDTGAENKRPAGRGPQ